MDMDKALGELDNRRTEPTESPPKSKRELWNGDVPEKYRKWRLSDYSNFVAVALQPFFDGDVFSVFIHGSVGTKKTSIAAAILFEWRRRGLPSSGGGYGEFVPAYKACDAFRDFEKGSQKVEHWRNCPILVLDDIGAGRDTPHVTEQLLFLIQRRYDRDRATVITSNLDLAGLGQHLDDRAASRMQEGVMLNLGTKDVRAKGKDDD